MKIFKFKGLYSISAFVAILFIFSSSCKKDSTVTPTVAPGTPDYVGTWVVIEPLVTDYGTFQMKDIMTFTDSTVTDLGQVQILSTIWLDYASMKGSIKVNGNVMTVNMTDLGLSGTNSLGIPTGVITSYHVGTDGFNNLLSTLGRTATFNSEYSVTGNQLTLKTDLNGNGNYLDPNETLVYTKQ